MKKLLIAALIFGVVSLMLFDSSTAGACSCAPPPPKVALEKSAAVFVGKVIAVEEKKYHKEVKKEVKFEVSKFWKGISSDTVTVTGIGESICGFPFEINKQYLVYASASEGQELLHPNICSRTKGLKEAKGDLAELGEGECSVVQEMTVRPNNSR